MVADDPGHFFFFGGEGVMRSDGRRAAKGAEKKRREGAYQKGGKEVFNPATALSMKAVV
jgi:hypothetical protein